MNDARESTTLLDEKPSRKEARRRSVMIRAVLWAIIVIAAVAGIGVFVAWRSLSGIERVPFDGSQARDRLESVAPEQAEQFHAEVEAAETAALEAELASGDIPIIDDQDLLGGARSALSDREITSGFEVPFATSSSIDDSVFDAYLLIGSDLSGSLADVIIYVLRPTAGGDPVMVSLPRDLYLPNPCTRTNTRLNAALNGCGEFANGPELLGLMVEDFTGIPVDHFAIVDFAGFAEVVDTVGGYEICVENPVRDSRALLQLDAGCTMADGETVLAWVRSRRTQELVDGRWQLMDGVSDFSRQERQQNVLLDIASKLTSFNSLTAFSSVVDKLQDSVTVDEGLDFAGLIDTMWDNRNIDLSRVERVNIPVENYTVDVGQLQAHVLVPASSFEQALSGTTVALREAGGA